jgi:cell division transport system permease protein
MKAFRILTRSIRDSFKSVFRNFSLSMASILCATITLLIVGVSLVVASNVENATAKLESELKIVVYLDKSSTDEDLTFLENKIKSMNNVSEVTVKSSDEWAKEMSTYSTSFENIFSYLDTNPLLNSLVVTVKDVSKLDQTTEEIKGFDKVNDANYGEDTAKPLLTLFDLVKKVTITLVVALIFVTAFLISNTIKLTIYSRRDNIEIMRLVGASNSAIKLPFVFEGFFIGVIGSIIPIIVLVYGYLILFEELNGQLFSELVPLVEANELLIPVSILILLIGAFVGMFGSARAVRKYLKI